MADEFQFADDIDRMITERVADDIVTAALALYKDIREDARLNGGEYGSAVRTGRYAASHRIALNQIDGSTAPDSGRGLGPDLSPSERLIQNPPMSEAVALMKQFKLGDDIFVSNSLHYAEKLEEGFSKKTPGGIYGPTLLWWLRRFEFITEYGAEVSR
jgi:hypothetical protein